MVALFAALTYTVSQGSRTGESQMTEKQAELAAVEILDYARNIKNAVRQLQINGCDDTEIDFGNNIYKQDGGADNYPVGSNTNAPADGSCGLFHINGAGLRPQIFYTIDPTPSGANLASGHATMAARDILGIGVDGQGDETFIISGINQKLCIALNNALNIGNTGDSPPVEVDTATIIGDEAAILVRKNAFCVYRDSVTNKRYAFYQVLIAK
jgi:hypothetical protein